MFILMLFFLAILTLSSQISLSMKTQKFNSTTFDYTICPKDGKLETQRRLTAEEWEMCGPKALSEFLHSERDDILKSQNATIHGRKRVSVPMRPSTAEEWAACPHKREDASMWAAKFADIDQDGLICWEEVATLARDLLSVSEKVLLVFAGPDVIMSHCAGNDSYISESDLENYKATCLRNCESVINFYELFVDRAVKKNYRPKPIKCTAPKSKALIEEGKQSVLKRKNVYQETHNKQH